MAIARSGSELRRWSNLSAIRRVLTARMPEICEQPVGLMNIAELCRRHALARPGRDWATRRDQILTIGCEWDLLNDSLEAQSDSCLDYLAEYLLD
jgi:hypothetical protein